MKLKSLASLLVASPCLLPLAFGTSTWRELKIVYKKNSDSFSKSVEGAPQDCYGQITQILAICCQALRRL